MHPQLAALEAEFDAARARLHRLADALAPERWASRPTLESWSAAECVAHLNLTSRAYVPLLRDAFERARGAGEVGTPRRHRRDPVGWLLSISSGPLPAIGRFRLGRVRTAPAFVPGGDLPMRAVVAEFDRLQDEQIGLLRAADGLLLGRIEIASPFDVRIHYNAFSVLMILPRHQHRHLGQAERAAAGER
jgi:hypothetical protein